MPDPLFGNQWNLDQGKSVFTAGFNPAKETRLYEERPNGYKLTVTGEAEGRKYTWWYEAFEDGKSYPVHGRDDVDAIIIYRVDSSITVGFFTNKGEDGGAYSRTLAHAGTSLKVMASGRRANGDAYYDIIHYHT